MRLEDAPLLIAQACATVDGLAATPDFNGEEEPPVVIVGAPFLTWDGYHIGPTEATYVVFLVVSADDRPLERIMHYLPQVARAMDEMPGETAAVESASPTTWMLGARELPAYELRVRVALTDD